MEIHIHHINNHVAAVRILYGIRTKLCQIKDSYVTAAGIKIITHTSIVSLLSVHYSRECLIDAMQLK